MKPGWVIAILIPLVAWGVLRDVANTANGGSIDLRNRVTGARIASAGIDPYSYKWSPGQPEAYCDLYNEPGALLSKTTVTPWVLAVHAPFNSWNYRTTQWCWFFLQYGCLVAIAWLWLRSRPAGKADWGMVLILAFSLTPSWRDHVDHGQIYVAYSLLLLVAHRMSNRTASPWNDTVEGCCGALLAGSRPVLVAQFASPLKRRRWLALAVSGLTLAIVFLLPMLLFRAGVWNHYRIAMEAHGEIYLSRMLAGPVSLAYPGTIEGIPLDTLARFAQIPFADTSIFGTISYLLPHRLILIVWASLMLGTLGFLAWRKTGNDITWWAVTSWLMVGDFLLPAFRHPYNDVLAIPMMLCGIVALSRPVDRKIWTALSGLAILLMITTWPLKSQGWFLPLPSLTCLCLGLIGIAWSTSMACRPGGTRTSGPA
jgi:hypothetical protein